MPRTALCLVMALGFCTISLAESPSASQVEQSRQEIERQEALAEKIRGEEKIYVKKITVKGVILLTHEEMRDIVSLYQKHWLTRREIGAIMEDIKAAYRQRGFKDQPAGISYQLKKSSLQIDVDEKKR